MRKNLSELIGKQSITKNACNKAGKALFSEFFTEFVATFEVKIKYSPVKKALLRYFIFREKNLLLLYAAIIPITAPANTSEG